MTKTIIIKYGGNAMLDDTLKLEILSKIGLLVRKGFSFAVVHGGGPVISEMLDTMGIKSRFHRGLRITTPRAMEVTEMVLSGGVNKELVGLGKKVGLKTVGLSGRDGQLFEAVKIKPKDGVDLGRVGRISQVNPELITVLMEKDFVPIISPVCGDNEGRSLNVNADHVAGALGQALDAHCLIFLTDVDGIHKNQNNGQGEILSALSAREAQSYIEDGTIHSGMIPKVETCLHALAGGVRQTRIINGCRPETLTNALNGGSEGTVIHR